MEDPVNISPWIPLNPRELNQPIIEDTQGITVTTYTSPYDVPEAVRGYRDMNSNLCTIEFKYMGGKEPLKPETENDTTLWIGRKSGRLYRIELGQEANQQLQRYGLAGVNEVKSEVDRAIDLLTETPRLPLRKDNYEIAKKVLNYNVELFERFL